VRRGFEEGVKMSPSARKIADAWEGKKRKDGINERPTRKPPEPPKGQGVRTPDDPLDEDVCRVGGLAMSNSREDWLSDKVDLLESDVERMRFHKAVLLWTLIMENVLLWLLAW
jgi:hypothetical protein